MKFSYILSKEETKDVNILIDDVIIQNREQKILLLTYLAHLSIWLSWKMEVCNMKALSFYFQNLKAELTNLVSIQGYDSLTRVYRLFYSTYTFLHTNVDVIKIMEAWELTDIFLKVFIVHNHCTKFSVSIISLSTDKNRGQKWSAGLNRCYKA